jgi:hypothetical protein
MRRVKPVSYYRGIGDVTHKAKPVAKVRYDVRCRRMADMAREEQVTQPCDRMLIDGSIRVLNSEMSLYTDELYTLRLEAQHGREFDFHTEPVDVVAGVYHVTGHGGFRE